MAENQQLEYHGQEEDNEETGIIYTKSLPIGKQSVDFTVSSDIYKTLLKKDTWKVQKKIEKKPKMQLASARASASNLINVIDTFDRPGDAIAEGLYARTGTYADSLENKPGKRIPKAGAYAEAGVGRARAEFSVFDAEAKDEESDRINDTRLHEGQHGAVSSEMIVKSNRQDLNMKFPSVGASTSKLINMIDTYDRPGDAAAEGTYAGSRSYSSGFKDEPGNRIPKVGYHAEAGVGRARAEFSVFDAEAKGPNASVGAEASVTGVGAMARAEVVSVSANAGPVGVKAGLGFDTGASVGADGVEVKFLGTGISVGPKTSISVLGSEVSCSVM